MHDKPKKFSEQHQSQPGKENEMYSEPEVIRKDYKGNEKLKDKVAVITGGDSGIGRSVAVHFAREGADITIVYLSEDEDANKTYELVKQVGVNCKLIKGDIREREFCKEIIDKTIIDFGHLNILVNNAGEQYPVDSLEGMDIDLREKTFRTNIFSMFYLTKEALKYLKDSDSIINTTSVTNYRGSGHLIDYSSTKGAITAFTRYLGKNLALKGIRVNCVAPGPIRTSLILATFDKVSDFGTDTTIERTRQPSEVAPSYVFLASKDFSYIKSQIIISKWWESG